MSDSSPAAYPNFVTYGNDPKAYPDRGMYGQITGAAALGHLWAGVAHRPNGAFAFDVDLLVFGTV